MASKIIGRMTCPECDFHGAHIKESEKCIYRYCPECQSQTIAKTTRQRALMTGRMRPVADATGSVVPAPVPPADPTGSATPPTAPVAPKTPTFAAKLPPAAPVATAPARRRGLFG